MLRVWSKYDALLCVSYIIADIAENLTESAEDNADIDAVMSELSSVVVRLLSVARTGR